MWSNRQGWMVALVLALMVGCTPRPSDEQEVSIGFLRGLYRGYPLRIVEDYVVEGEVVSSDRYGAFSHQLFLQDSTGGVAFMIDDGALYATYSVGDRVRVWCRGLTLGGYGGSVRVGGGPDRDWQVSRLTPAEWSGVSRVVGHNPQVAVLRRTIATLGADDMARLVRIDVLRVVEAGQAWPEPRKESNVAVVDVAVPEDTLLVRIVGHRELEGVVLPDGEVSLMGVADYFGGRYQVQLASPDGFLER